jgi:putative oxidoreductase
MGSADKAALFLRIFAGILLFTQAITKSQDYLWLSEEYPTILGIGAPKVVSIVGIVELVAGVLLTVGLFTRITAVVMAVVMFAAAFLFFPGQSFDQGELKFIYAGIYITLAISGGGRYSLDNLVAALRGSKART